MKEVTRIRIAKVSYDIELAAKKKLESYVDSLSDYAEDENVLEDIEIRMTELLEKRDVRSDGVITSEDVAFIRETLGEPQYFLGDGDIAVGPEDRDSDKGRRKLYRDLDGAVLGGVLGGFALFLRVNVLWVRLAFFLLLFVSFGFAAVLYVILWIAIPAARSVAEKLQLRGESVTLGSIRKYAESHEGRLTFKQQLLRRRKVFGIIVGFLGVLVSLGALLTTAFAVIAWFVNKPQIADSVEKGWLVFGLGIGSGVLLTLLGVLISYHGFKTRVTKRAVVTAIVVAVTGIAAFSAAAGIVGYDSWQRQQAIYQSVKEKTVTLPPDFRSVRRLIVDVDSASVMYRVSEDVRATVIGVPSVTAEVTQEGDQATVRIKAARLEDIGSYVPTIVIYGPQLPSLVVESGIVQYTANTQELEVSALEASRVSVYGNYTVLKANIQQGGSLSAEGASVKTAVIDMESNASANFGNVDSLTVIQPTACPNNAKAQLWVEGISAASLTYNGMAIPKTSQQTSCGMLQVGGATESSFYQSTYN